ncbi:MAG: hypothetical protein JWO82_2914, partial [Akkermansiaceae bacterium]|nr:hypothetical protein [Akkermansiaceae bacterium]
MKELLAGMGADAVAEIFDQLALSDNSYSFEKEFLDSIYAAMNPSQALLLALGRPDSGPGKQAVLKAFTSWTYSDPEAAWHWQREEMRKGNPGASIPAMQMQAAICSSRFDPQMAAEAIERLNRTIPGSVGPDAGSEIAKVLRTPEERISLLHALDSTAAGSPDGGMIVAVRASVVRQLNVDLLFQSPLEAVPVLDTAFTREERQDFANQRGGSKAGSPAEAKDWAPWLAGQEAPSGFVSPVSNFMAGAATRFPELLDDLGWIEKLPAPEARQRAIAAMVPLLGVSHPEEA